MDGGDSDFRRPRRGWVDGEVQGHGDGAGRARRRDGVVARGEEIAYVDEQGQIHRPDGLIVPGQVIGQVKGRGASAPDGLLPGAEWGYVDDQGYVHLRDNPFTAGRIIGEVRGGNVAAALAFYVRRFDQLRERVDDFIRRTRAEAQVAKALRRTDQLIEQVGSYDGLGDFRALLDRLHVLRREILHERQQNGFRKEVLLDEARRWSQSSDWREAGSRLQALTAQWRELGPALEGADDLLWSRFREAQDTFYRRRDEHAGAVLASKGQLVAEAERVRDWADLRAANDRMRELLDAWKQAGSGPRQPEQELWQRFQAARDALGQRYSAWREARQRERAQAAATKGHLCAEAEALQHSSEWRETHQRLQALHAAWKQAGHAGRDDDDALWSRFRAACDTFYTRRELHFAEQSRIEQQRCDEYERLVHRALGIDATTDPRAAKELCKELQADWRAVGRVSREAADDLYGRFRAACDSVFTRANEELDRRRLERQERMREALDRKSEQAQRLQESIEHDEGLISDWEDKIACLHDGGRADEIRDALEEKISSVSDKVRGKRERLSELLDAVRDIESKL